MEPVLHALADALTAHRQTLATAESCTGGLVGATFTDPPGSSAWFLGGIIAYANSLKTNLLGVSPDTLNAHGAVSVETARAMAEGARQRTGADFAVALTGIAGPSGGTPEKPVGLIFIAVASPSGTSIREHRFSGNRAQIRAAATQAALAHVLEIIQK